MPAVKFRTGLSKDLPKNRNSNTLYWVTDTRQLYKGNDLYNDAVRIVSELPAEPITGVLYIVNGVVKAYTGSEWVDISVNVTNDSTDVSEDKVMSSAAVADAIKNAIETALGNVGEGGSATPENVVNTVVSTEAGTITVTKGSTDESVKLAGVVYEPSYDSTTRTITLPYNKLVDGAVQEDTLVIALGQDMVVTSDSYYDSDNKKIVLALSTGGTIEIPVEDLVSTIKISDTTGNALVENEDGLFVKDLSGDISNINGRLDTINTTISEMTDETNGILAQAKAYADTKVGQVVWEVFEEETV